MTKTMGDLVKEMEDLVADLPDEESAHVAADVILCQALEVLEYENLVELYNRVTPKWYA